MARFRMAFLLSLLLVLSLASAAVPDSDPPSKLTPAMLELLEQHPGPHRVWVFFTDKGQPDPASRQAAIAEVAATYNPRAIERRLRRGRHAIDGSPLFDVRDLSVHEPYVQEVAQTGARIRIRSRWLNAISAIASERQIDAIKQIPAVTRIQPVAFSKLPQYTQTRSQVPTPQTPTGLGLLDYGLSTSQLDQINLIALHNAGYTADNVIIGVLDTGFRRDHDAFNQPGHEINVIAEYDFVDDDPDTSNEVGDFISQHDHGTMILATMATYFPGEMVGGAFDASFVLAKTEDTTDEYQAEEDNYVAGLEFAEAHGADMTTSSIGYINWYTQADLDGETAVTTIAVNAASDMGVHTVTAAGNSGHDADPATSHLIAPADAFNVITTGAVTPTGGNASFSSDGPSADGRVKPEVMARGQSTATVDPSATTGYLSVSGTSISTPQVAAAVACLIQAYPDLTVQQMREALFVHANYDPGGLGFDPAFVRGYGVIDALASQLDAFIPAGFVLFDRDVYSCSDSLTITLRDDNIPGDPETVTVELSSSTETLPEIVTLTRVTPGINRYEATLPTTADPPSNGDGTLSLSHGDLLDVQYVDADDGAGGFGIPVQDIASADCQPPAISDVEAGELTGATARITWQTDEPADSRVTYGLTPPGLSSESDSALVTSHDLQITGLQECSPYFYSVSSADGVANQAVDDNGGAFHTFETLRDISPDYGSTDTPLPIEDEITFISVLEVPDSKIVGDVNVTVDISHTWDADLILKLLPPTGSPILLVDQQGENGDDFDNTVFDDEATTPIAEGTPPFAGTYQPESPLAAADGIDSQGPWTLIVTDDGLLDSGTLHSWTLTLTYLAEPCGPHATGGSASTEGDLCTTGGAGDADGHWDAGEYVDFGVTIKNDGQGTLTGVWAEVTPLTPGIVMLDWRADYPDLPEGAAASSLAPHFTAKLPENLLCGDPLDFAVTIHANEGSWSGGTASRVAGEVIPGSGVALLEDFEAGLPGTWTVVDDLNDGWTWFVDNGTDPLNCNNFDGQFPILGNWMAADSDCAGPGVPMDEQLITPLIDLGAAVTAAVEFDHYFSDGFGGNDTADVDVRSSLTLGNWVNVASWSGASTDNPEHAVVDITTWAAGASNVQVRWHYYDAEFDRYWFVDNVSVSFTGPDGCEMVTCNAAASAPPPVPDGTGAGDPIVVERLDAGGTQLRVTWDDGCSPVAAKILYGPLGGVATYSLAGAVCGIAQPQVWDPVPAGDLWLLVVSEDGSGVEGSWGLATPFNERNGLVDSGTCGGTSKDVSGSCP